MSAVWVRVKADLRTRRRATVALALLIGLGGGLMMTAAAGARRTGSAYPRFLRAHGSADLLAATNVGGASFFDGEQLSVQDFARMPAVEAAQLLRFYVIRNPLVDIEDDDAFMTVDAHSPERRGPSLDTYKVLEGRAPDPSRPEEAVLTLLGAESDGLRVGARFRLEGLPQVFPDFAQAAERKPLEIHVVGRVAAPGDFPPQSGDETVALHMTPTFYERYPETAFGFPGGVVLRLEDTAGAADRFREGYRAAGGNPAFTIERAAQDANVQRSIRLQAAALWLLAALGAAAFVLVFGQTLSRQIFIESDDHPALAALGFTRGQLVVAVLSRALAACIGGAVAAVAVSVLLSPLLPSGLARVAEPRPGFALDALVAGGGSAAIMIAVLMLGAWPAWRSASPRAQARALASDRPSILAELVGRAGRLPALVAGARLALQRGRGRTAMPVRTTIAGLTLGIGVLAAAGTFAASLDHFLASPPLYGVTWDARVGVEPPEVFSGDERVSGGQVDLAPIAHRLMAADDRVRGVSIGTIGLNLAVDDLILEAMILQPVAGAAPMPPLLEGTYPQERPRGETQEIVLGRRALDRLHASVGDTIDASFLDAGEVKTPLKVVGVAVVPVFVDSSRLGESALLPPGVLAGGLGLPEDFENSKPDNLFVAGRADATLVSEIAALVGPDVTPGEEVHIWPDGPPTDIVNFGRVQRMPQVLGLLLAVFAAATLAHTLVTAVSRRRRDLAILKTLGFVRRQVRLSVLVQSLVLSCLSLAFGIPAGIAIGRWVWRLFAADLGIVPHPVIYGITIAIGVTAALAMAGSISILPARAAARTQPATVLRSE